MALNRNTRYPGRFDAPTSAQPQGAFKNRTSDMARDGSYFEKDWINDIVAPWSAALARTNQTANGNVDAVGASQYFDSLERMRVTEPLNNTWNGFFRRSQAGISSPAGFPATGGTVYAANAEFTLNWFSGAAANNIAITDANGITFTQPIYIQFNLDAASDLEVGDIYIHIVDQGGNPHWFKNGEAGGAVVITKSSNTLRVQLAASILSFSGITSIKSAFVQSEAGFISELDNGSVSIQSLALLQTLFPRTSVYGLGGVTSAPVTGSNFNLVTLTGFYTVVQGASNVMFDPGVLTHIEYPSGAAQINIDRETGAVAIRSRNQAGVWLAWERLTPMSYVDARSPVGSVVAWTTGAVPTGFLEMNGQTFNAVTYPTLNTLLGGNTLPDLRGEFIRGFDNGRGVDAGRGIRTVQAQDVQSHTHTLTRYGQLAQVSAGAAGNIWDGTGPGATGATGGPETRPRNVALMFIIKAN